MKNLGYDKHTKDQHILVALDYEISEHKKETQDYKYNRVFKTNRDQQKPQVSGSLYKLKNLSF